jgi:CRP-like cAMP-binding protein
LCRHLCFTTRGWEREGLYMKKPNKSPRTGARLSSRMKEADLVLKTGLKQAALKNKILAALPAKEFDRLMPGLKIVELKLNEILHVVGERIEYVYFLSSGIVSMLTMLEGGTTIEAAVIGSEGIVGLSVIMGVEKRN